MGGDCLNYRLRALEGAARRRQGSAADARGARFGVDGVEPHGRFRQVHRACARRDRRDRARTIPPERFTGLGVRVIAGCGAASRTRDTVEAGDGIRDQRAPLRHRHRLVAGASRHRRARRRPVPHQRDDLRSRQRRPAHLVIIGGGPIGLELAQAFRRLGAAVTVLEAADAARAKDDPECGGHRARGARARGRRHPRAASTSCASSARRDRHPRRHPRRRGRSTTIAAAISWSPPAARPARMGSASSRPASPATAAASWSTDGLRTTQPARLCHRRRRRRGRSSPMSPTTRPGWSSATRCSGCRCALNEDIVPRVTFTDPELAQVGLTEDEARARAAARSASCAGPITRTTAPRPSARPRAHQGAHRPRDDPRRHHRGRGAGGADRTWALAMASVSNIRDIATWCCPIRRSAKLANARR